MFITIKSLQPHCSEPVRIKRTDASKLQDEYAKLVEGLQDAANDEDSFIANPGQSIIQSPLTVAYSINHS